MKVLGFMHPQSGVGYHRIALPVSGLRGEPGQHVITNDLTEERVKDYDVLLYNRFIDTVDLDTLKAWRKKYGIKLVCDVDDYWHLHPHHILYQLYERGMRAETLRNVEAADLVTTTHWRLAVKIREHNKNVLVIPNALPYDRLQFVNAWEPYDDGVRFGYAGGVTHEKDVDLLKGPLRRIAGDQYLQQRCIFMILGYNDGNAITKKIWDRMAAAYTANGKLRHHVIQAAEPWDYMEFYRMVDVCLVPLEATGFNTYKSNLKFLEAAANYQPVISSAVAPYTADCPEYAALWVDYQTDWYKHIKYLANNEAAREAGGEMLGEWARTHHHLDKWSEVRRQVFEALIKTDKKVIV